VAVLYVQSLLLLELQHQRLLLSGIVIVVDSKAKGDRAEREIAFELSTLLGRDIERKLGAGRAEDTGDLYGLTNWTAQVADWKDALRAIRQKPEGAEQQRINAKTEHAVTFIRLRGGMWRAVQTLPQWCNTYESTLIVRDR